MSIGTRYRAVRALASGGAAEVLEGEALEGSLAGRRVALKRLLSQHAHRHVPQRMFVDEARIVRQLDHPNIVRLLDYGDSDEGELLVFEFVDGLDAGRIMRLAHDCGRPVPDSVALYVVAHVAEALDYAHRRADTHGVSLGIVHRDVNPANVLVSWQGEVRLTDFGIARARERHEQTTTGVVKGKVGYVTPEQASGQAVDSACDVYALGATLHALIAGRPPLTTWPALAKRVAGAPLSLDESIAEDVARLIHACMAVDTEQRPAARRIADATLELAQRRGCQGPLTVARWLEPLRDATNAKGSLDDLMRMPADDEDTAREFRLVSPS